VPRALVLDLCGERSAVAERVEAFLGGLGAAIIGAQLTVVSGLGTALRRAAALPRRRG
jgi:hypothetical protein